MNEFLWVALVLVWVLCGMLGYVLVKRDFIRTMSVFGIRKWTKGDRVFALFISIGGPATLLIGLCKEAANLLAFDWNEEASW